MAEADDEQAAPPQLPQRPAAPLTGPEREVGGQQLPVQRGHRHEGVLGDPVLVPVDVGDEAARGQRLERDPVVPGADGMHESQARRRAGPAGTECAVHEHVGVADGPGHLLA